MVGRQVSHFRVQSRIGAGGMGEVYLADDLALDRRVALKVVSDPDREDPAAARRLLREAHASASLDHPFVCKIYEAGESDGRAYIAMEYVEGTTLEDRLRRGPMPVQDALRFATEIAEALECAHAHGIIHRDLKPSNVMIGVDGHVKVMDFGIAQRLSGVGTVAATTRAIGGGTEQLAIAGTLAYCSPEQLRGLPIDARSDVFSFGIVLHELLTTVHPFRRGSVADTVDALLNETPPPLAVASTELTPLLDHVVRRCLEKDADRRYASCRDIRIELQSLATGTGSAVAVPKRRPRRRLAAAAGGLFMVGAAAAALWYAPEWLHVSESALAFNARDWIIITDCENLTGDTVFDRSLGAALDVGIGQSNYVNVYSRDRLQTTLQRMRKKLSGPVDLALASEVAQRDNVRAVLTCSIGKVGEAYTLAGRIVDPRTQRIALTESVQASGKTDVLPALDQLAARLRRRLGESIATLSSQHLALPQATTSSLEALKMFAESQRVDKNDAATAEQLLLQAIQLDPDFAMAHALLGHHYFLSAEPGTRRDGEEHVAKALSLSNRLTTRERLLIQAAADDARGNREKAAIEYRSYLSQYPDDTRVWFRLGWTYMAGLSQPENAIEAFNRVIAIDPRDDSALINLATSYTGLRQFERAVETYRKAFALNPDDVLGIFVNGEYGAALMQTGRLAEAQDAFERMAASKNSISRARGLRSLAFLSMYRGQYAAAIARLRESVPLNQAADATVSVYRDRLIVARALLALGRTEEARRELLAVEALTKKETFGPEWLVNLAKIYARTGYLRDAERIAALMPAGIGNAVAASSTNRNTSRDQAFYGVARAEIAVAKKKPEEGVSLASEAAGRMPANRTSALDTLAFALAAAGRTDEAIVKYEQLLGEPWLGNEAQEEWFDAHLALGRIYERIGRAADARRLYEQVITRWKDGDADVVLLKTIRARLGAAPPVIP